jgi:integrase/recombinase XerD
MIRAALLEPAWGYKKATIESALWALRSVLKFAERMGFMPFDDYRRAVVLESISGETLPAGRALEADEIAKLRTYCASEEGIYGRFLDATFALLLGVGLRANEACTMPIAGYDVVAGVVRVRRKRGKEVELPVDERAAECLDAWMCERQSWRQRINSPVLLLRVQKNDWVNELVPVMTVRTLEYVLKCVAEAAGVAPFTPHDLRRTFATMLLDADVGIERVQELMSHEDPKTTERYDRRGAAKLAKARRDVKIW